MHTELVDFSETECFDKLFLDYLAQKDSLKPFFNLPAQIEFIEQQIEQKNFSQEKRRILQQVFREQYSQLDNNEIAIKQIDSLGDANTYTLVTGHQLNSYTGPLYFHYKIMTVIKAAQKLSKKYPNYHFIPVYWMATEDHDLEEIAQFNYEGEKLKWKTDQSGAVGRMTTKGLSELAKFLPKNASFLAESYEKSANLAEAVRKYVHKLYGQEGLLVLDADHVLLKKQLVDIIKDDVFLNTANVLVEQTNSELKKAGYKTQGFPREINFFYLGDGFRGRIHKHLDYYEIIDTDLVFTADELNKEIQQHPERFSPNVMMRPLYQELILPNISYTGGPAEVAYWLQLKAVFDHYKIAFPILLPRVFALFVPFYIKRKVEKLQLRGIDLFQNSAHLEKRIVKNYGLHDTDVDKESEQIMKVFEALSSKAEQIDPLMKRTTAGFAQKTKNLLDALEKKMIRGEKRKIDDKIRQLHSIKQILFPQGNLQERSTNFLDFYGENDQFLKEVMATIQPFSLQFHILWQDE